MLLSDFGTRDPYASLMKAAIKRINPSAIIEDLTHGIQHFCIVCGAYVLYTSYLWYPENSIYVSVVDPGVGGERRGIILRVGDRYFVGPDNGLLWPIAEGAEEIEAYAIDEHRVSFWQVSSTFHGRDVFAPASARLSLEEEVEKFAEKIDVKSLKRLSLRWSEMSGEWRCFKVIYIDSFGDTVLSAAEEEAEHVLSLGKLDVKISNQEVGKATVSRTFSLVPEGEMAAYINSFGFLELSINKGNFAERFGIKVGDLICLK